MRRRVIVTVLLVAGLAAAGVAGWTQRRHWLPAAGHDPGPGAHAAHGGPADLQSVKLSDEAVRGLGLVSAPAVVENYRKVVEVPAVIVDPPGVCDRAVAAPVAGVVYRVHTVPGETVRAGDPLFTLHLTSELVQGAQTDLARAAKDLTAATARRDQTKKLVAAGTKPGIELTDDENAVRRLATQVQGYRRQLRVFGLTPEQVKQAEAGDFITEVVVGVPADAGHEHALPLPAAALPVGAAPFTYEVESLAVSAGQGVTGGQLLARLANHHELLIEGRAFESEAPLVAAAARDGHPVGVDLLEAAPGDWDPVVQKFVIRSVGNTLDPATRTFPFYVPLTNQAKAYARGDKTYLSWRFRPGQKVRLRVPVGVIPNAIVLPAGAVVRDGADTFVFRRNGEVFDRKAVSVVAEDRLTVAIAPGNGIEDGVMVLRNHADAVNRALKAAQARGPGDAGGRRGHWHADGSFHEADD